MLVLSPDRLMAVQVARAVVLEAMVVLMAVRRLLLEKVLLVAGKQLGRAARVVAALVQQEQV